MLNQLLRKSIALTSALVPLTTLNPEVTLAAQQDFRVYNRTALTMVDLFVSPSSSPDWWRVSGFSWLPGGFYDDVVFPSGTNSCYFDIKAVFSNGYYLGLAEKVRSEE
jgi:hypothetical protein